MESAVLLVIVGAVAAGVVAAVVTTWSLRARLYSLEDRTAIVEGILQREVKVRAAAERWKRPSPTEEAAALLKQSDAPQQQRKMNWWENPALKKGGYVP